MTDAQIVSCPDGRLLAYDEHGSSEGPALFLFHGTPGSRLERDPLGRPFTARVVSIDRPGYGQSSPHPGRRLVDWPTDVLRVADSLGIDRFSVLGISGGGPYAVACAALIPERLHRVGVLCGVGPISEPWTDEGTSAQNASTANMARFAPESLLTIGDAIAAAVQAAPDATTFFESTPNAEAPAPDVAVSALAGPREMLFRSLKEATRQGGGGFADDYRVLAQPWGLDLAMVTVPVHLLHGEMDNNVPASHARWLASQIPGSTLRVLPDEGHMSLVVHHAHAFAHELVA